MSQNKTLNPDLLKLLKESGNILVVTGAGISTSAGIIDFRSPGGLYSVAVERYNLPYPEAIFDIAYFHKNPAPFFRLSAELLLADIEPTPCHHFLVDLEAKGKIGILVTQNIDMLHEKAGSKHVIECHGSYRTGRCLSCGKRFEYKDFSGPLLKGEIPHCQCGGIIKPDVVFFGESLPESFMSLFYRRPKVDLLLVLGTSLTVQPVSSFALDYAPRIPSILVNRDPTPYDGRFSYVHHGELDDFAQQAWDNVLR